MDILSKSTILYINQTRQENFEKLIGKGISEALSWYNDFEQIIFLCYSSTGNFLYKKKHDNCYLIGIPFDLSSTTFKSIFSIGKNYIDLYFFLNRLSNKTKIDIVRIENLLISGLPAYIFCKIKNIPYVVWLGGFERKSLFIKYKKNIFTYFLSKLIILFEKIILKNSNFVFAVTNELLDLTEKRNVKNKILSPNFVDLLKFKNLKKQNTSDSNKKSKILYVGRFEEEKGIKVLMNAIKILSLDNFETEFLLIGDGSLKEWILNFLKNNNLKNVKLLGSFSHEEMPLMYNMADIFVLPSYTEGSPASLIEAMSCGIASIATAVGLCPSLIKNGKNGILVPSGKPLEIANAIKKLIMNKDLLEKISKNGRKAVVKYTKNYKKIHKYMYEKILNQ
ncbi:MAG: glycosyltransferase [Candidatus Hermodarchaeota archaeon]